MCEYCKMEQVSEREMCNNTSHIFGMRDGSHQIDVLLYRYEVDGGKTSKHTDLILDLFVKDIDGNGVLIEEVTTKIKYCPFCGEEL